MARRKHQKLSWTNASIPAIVSECGSNTEVGLTHEKVLQLREVFGLNVLETEEELSIVDKIYKQFKSPLVFILLAAGIICL